MAKVSDVLREAETRFVCWWVEDGEKYGRPGRASSPEEAAKAFMWAAIRNGDIDQMDQFAPSGYVVVRDYRGKDLKFEVNVIVEVCEIPLVGQSHKAANRSIQQVGLW